MNIVQVLDNTRKALVLAHFNGEAEAEVIVHRLGGILHAAESVLAGKAPTLKESAAKLVSDIKANIAKISA